MKVTIDGFSFNFVGAIDAFVFDEKDKNKPRFHDQPMKAVDIIAEFKEKYIFVEIKDFYELKKYRDEIKMKGTLPYNSWLKEYLKYKYRDSYLFRHAECKVEKDIHYICLLANFDNGMNSFIQKNLELELPVGKSSKLWKQAIAESCQVVNFDKWNSSEVLSRWPVARIQPGHHSK